MSQPGHVRYARAKLSQGACRTEFLARSPCEARPPRSHPSPVLHESSGAYRLQGCAVRPATFVGAPVTASLTQSGTSSVVVALDFALPRSRAYFTEPGVWYFSRYARD